MIENHWSQQLAQGAVLLTVNQRLARHHRSTFTDWQLRQCSSWWESPAIYPLNAWLVALHEQALIQGLLVKSLLPELLAHQAWQRCIDNDTQITLLDSGLATDMAMQSWQLSQSWLCFNQQDQYLTRDQYTWQKWMNRYCQWLESEDLIDADLLPGVLTDLFNNQSENPAVVQLLPAQLILDGFVLLTPQLERLIDSIRALGVKVLLPERKPDAVVHHQSFNDDDSELLAIAAQMRAELERDPEQVLGLVVPDLRQRRGSVVRALDRVFFPASTPDEIRSFTRPYDVSLGVPLIEQAVIVSALLQLKLCFEQVRGSDISVLLLNPYWIASRNESAHRQQLDKRLRENRVGSLDLQQLQKYLRSDSALSGAITRLKKNAVPRQATLTSWGDVFSTTLKTLGWPTDSIDTEEYQAVSAWFECFDDLQLLDSGEHVSVSTALSQLTALLKKRMFQLDVPDTPIQIMGRLESHGIGFDCLWLAGLDDEQWPPAGSPSPFLSIAQQKACQVPQSTAVTRLGLAEAEFRLWASAAPLLIVSSANERNGNALSAASLPTIEPSKQNLSLVKSRLARLESVGAPPNPARLISEAMVIEEISDASGPSLAAGSAVKGGARLFENQALCPFKAFALHRLQIRPLEEPGLGLDARQHGNLLHEALELFWESVKSHEALMALSEEQLLEQVSCVVSNAIESAEVPERLIPVEKRRLSSLLLEWIANCEMPRTAFVVDNLEQRLQIEHGGITMTVILDRVDRVVDKGLVVIDYKTGVNNKIGPWADDRIANPQLPLYVLTNNQIQAAGFAQVASNQCKFLGVASDDETLPKVRSKLARTSNRISDTSSDERTLTSWNEWREHWKNSLDIIASEVRSGVASVTPMKTACQFCELKSLCRINEHEPDRDQLASQTDAGLIAQGDA